MNNIVKFDKTALDIIKESKILTSEDLKVLEDYKEELANAFMINQIFRTRTEMDVSVLNDMRFPTPDSKYWQVIREQNLMFQETINMSFDYRKKQVLLKKLRKKLEETTDELEREEIQIDIERIEFDCILLERVAKDRIREIKEWQDIKEQLKPQLQYSQTDVNEHQLVSYAQRFIHLLLLMNEKTDVQERQNIIGQVHKSLIVASEKGVIDKVFAIFPAQVKQQLLTNFGIQEKPKFSMFANAK